MDNNYIKESFESIGVSESRVMRRVSDGITDKRKRRRVPKTRAMVACCLAVIVVGTAASFIPGASTFAQDVLRSWGFTVKADNATLEVKSEYVTLPSTKASMTKANFSSIAEIEKVLGVDILDSPDAYTGAKGLYEYIPGVKDGKLYSATIMNNLYSIGDLKNFRADIDAHDYSDVSFERGEKYSLPIFCEITIRGERNDGTEDTVFEKMDSWDLVDEGVEIIKYKPAQIDAEVAVYTITDKQMLIGLLADIESGKIEQGDVAPASREGEEDTTVTIAQFVYNNVSYLYSTNELSVDDMKAFLDTLAPSPDTKDNNASVKVEGEYVELPSAKASMTEAKFSSIDEIEKVIGVDILESPDAYTGTKGMYQYYPGVKDGKLFSATIMNGAYAIGDLKNFRAEVDMDDLSSDPETSFERGNKYHSALCFEITIRGERDDGTDSTEYESDNWDLPEGVEIIKYKPAQIDAEVALYTLMMGEYMNGMDGWEGFVGVEPMAIAQFAYNNTSYIYMARVSIDDMKAFLDTLALGK